MVNPGPSLLRLEDALILKVLPRVNILECPDRKRDYWSRFYPIDTPIDTQHILSHGYSSVDECDPVDSQMLLERLPSWQCQPSSLRFLVTVDAIYITNCKGSSFEIKTFNSNIQTFIQRMPHLTREFDVENLDGVATST